MSDCTVAAFTPVELHGRSYHEDTSIEGASSSGEGSGDTRRRCVVPMPLSSPSLSAVSAYDGGGRPAALVDRLVISPPFRFLERLDGRFVGF